MGKKTKKKPNTIGWLIFLATIEIALISIIPIIFPALITRTVSPITISPVDSFELGYWAIPMILTNCILLGFGIAYYKNKLPKVISNSIKFIFNFEVSKKVAFFVMLTMLVIYVSLSVQELALEEPFGDYSAVKETVLAWNVDKILEGFDLHVRFFLLGSSLNLFENIRVLPFIASIALLILTYFITLELAQKRFSGLIAVAILLQSPVFLRYDTTATYENFWTLFYLLSLYSIYKAWPASAVFYILSIFSKPITAIFFPMNLFLIYRANILRKKKIRLLISYLVFLAIGIGAVVVLGVNPAGTDVAFIDRFFWDGFVSLSFQLRYDALLILFLLPVIFGLFIASRKGILQAESVMILIAGMLFSAPLVTGFTDITNQPYRFVPLVLFFAIGVGMILSNRKK